MTHTAWSQFKCPAALIDLITPTFWTGGQKEDIVLDMNFGTLEVILTLDRSSDSFTLRLGVMT